MNEKFSRWVNNVCFEHFNKDDIYLLDIAPEAQYKCWASARVAFKKLISSINEDNNVFKHYYFRMELSRSGRFHLHGIVMVSNYSSLLIQLRILKHQFTYKFDTINDIVERMDYMYKDVLVQEEETIVNTEIYSKVLFKDYLLWLYSDAVNDTEQSEGTPIE